MLHTPRNKTHRTVLMAPMDAFGHFNGCIAMGQELMRRGYRVVFEAEYAFVGQFSKYGFEEVYYGVPPKGPDDKKEETWTTKVVECVHYLRLPVEEKMKLRGTFMIPLVETAISREPDFARIMKDVKPDLVIIDSFVSSPAHIFAAGVPWVFLCSANPLHHIVDDRTPPHGFGFPADKPEMWETGRRLIKEATVDCALARRVNEWLTSLNYPPVSEQGRTHHLSPYLNIYMYPAELDYDDLRPTPPLWYRAESLVRVEDSSSFEIPEEFQKKPGRLILISMGSLASHANSIMTTICEKLKNCSHKFIVVTGKSGVKVYDNMLGIPRIPQTVVLPLVDLFITHGGNNSVCESVYFGKPMIVLPLFADQPDNAQRVQEKGFGRRMNMFDMTEDDIMQTIEELLNDEPMQLRMRKISERLQSSDTIGKLCDQLVAIVDNKSTDDMLNDASTEILSSNSLEESAF